MATAIDNLRAGSARNWSNDSRGESSMEIDPNKVWPTGLTLPEAEELHRHVIEGTRIFGFVAALAHLLAYVYTPWLH